MFCVRYLGFQLDPSLDGSSHVGKILIGFLFFIEILLFWIKGVELLSVRLLFSLFWITVVARGKRFVSYAKKET